MGQGSNEYLLTADPGTVDTPVLVRIAKFLAVPSRTGAGPAASAGLITALCDRCKQQKKKKREGQECVPVA